MPVIDRLRLLGTPDTNKVMMGELSRLAQRGLSRRPPNPRKYQRAGLVYPFDPALAALAVKYQRTITRALWELYESPAQRLEPLYDDVRAMVEEDSRQWYWNGAGISVRVRNVSEFAAGERQIVGTVKNALIDGARAHGATLYLQPERPDLSIDVRMHDDRLTVSLDLAGTSLSQRGYRTSKGAAPLREHLAAVLCMLGRYDARRQLLLDPMCGAGTICIEAALMANASPCSNALPPLFEKLPVFRDLPTLAGPLFADTRPLVLGNDIDRRVVQAARDNAERAGVTATSIWRCGDFRDITADTVKTWASSQNWSGEAGVIICNPPYGHRLDDRELVDLYIDLGDWCRQFPGWRAVFLVANDAWDEAFGWRVATQKMVKNGPLRSDVLIYNL